VVALQDLKLKRGARARHPLFAFARDFARFAGRRMAPAAMLLVLGALVEGIGLLLLVPLLGIMLGDTAAAGWLGSFSRQVMEFAPEASRAWQLATVLALFGALLAARACIILMRDVLLASLQVGFVEFHRLRIITLLANTRWDVISRMRHGRITHVLGSDVQACGDAAQLSLQVCVAIAILAGQVALAFLLSPPLALLVLVLLLVGAAAQRPILRRARQIGAGLTDANLHLVTSTTQFLGGLKLALSQDLQRGFVEEFEEASHKAITRRIGFVRQRTAVQLSILALAGGVAALTMLLGVAVLEIPAATLLAFLFVLARINGPTAQVQGAAQHVFHSLPAYAKIKSLEEELAGAQSGALATASPSRAIDGASVEFRNVSFSHDSRSGNELRSGLSDLTVAIEAESFAGITGPSGAGKTTFADLLVGLYPPQAGQVLVQGEPICDGRLAEWRRSISYVSQDPFLFHDSVRKNLLWACPEASEDELWQALRLAGAEELVRRMGSALEAVVGERGTLVSGGERQRIALARALIRKPLLLVLDEATNAIDVDGERQILQRLTILPYRPTVITITHRPAGLSLCERILEFRDGRLVGHA
jgi:ATP-binding cassette subfamily C protein